MGPDNAVGGVGLKSTSTQRRTGRADISPRHYVFKRPCICLKSA